MAPGAFLERYQLAEVLGSGSCGCVYAAEQRQAVDASPTSPTSPCAVKVLGLTRETRGRVRQEIEMLHALANREHCAQIVDSFLDDADAYIVMHRYDRPLPAALAAQKAFTEQSFASFFRQMFQAVANIHDAGVVHRDIKPDNFMCCGQDNAVKLVDLGYATWAPGPDECLHGLCGTPPFMSPEMLRKKGYNREIDVWAMGVSAYALLFGEFPYMPCVMDSRSMKHAIMTGAEEPSYTFAVDAVVELGEHAYVSDDAVCLIKRLLERDPSRRPTAEQALSHRWITSGTKPACSPANGPGPCLRPVLQAAARVNAFDAQAMATKEAFAQKGLGTRPLVAVNC